MGNLSSKEKRDENSGYCIYQVFNSCSNSILENWEQDRSPIFACLCSKHDLQHFSITLSCFWMLMNRRSKNLLLRPEAYDILVTFNNETAKMPRICFYACRNFFDSVSRSDHPMQGLIIDAINLHKVLPYKARLKWELEKNLQAWLSNDVIKLIKTLIDVNDSISITGPNNIFIQGRQITMIIEKF